MSTAPRVAVVGAGLAGVSAALTLKNAGAQVEIFERSRLVGGKATSFRLGDVEVDNGQHVVLACCTAFRDLLDDLGLTAHLHMQPNFEVTMLARGSRPARLRAAHLPAPLHLMPSFIAYPHLSWSEKVRAGAALLAARRQTAPRGDMAAWLRRHRQSATARRVFWDPFLVPALNAPLEEVAAADGLFVIRTAFLESRDAARIGYTTTPLARIAEAAARRADALHLRTPVTGVDAAAAGLRRLQLHEGVRDDFDACVLAIPPRRLSAIAGDEDVLGLHGLDAFRTQPIVDVHLWYGDRSRPLLGGAGFAAVLDSPVQWVFEKAPGYLCCSLSAAESSITVAEQELAQRCHNELAAVLPALHQLSPLRAAATRDPDATFVPAPDLRRPGNATAIDSVVVAGAWTDTGWPATMESAVRSGRGAAQLLLRRLALTPAAAPQGARAEELAHAI